MVPVVERPAVDESALVVQISVAERIAEDVVAEERATIGEPIHVVESGCDV